VQKFVSWERQGNDRDTSGVARGNSRQIIDELHQRKEMTAILDQFDCTEKPTEKSTSLWKIVQPPRERMRERIPFTIIAAMPRGLAEDRKYCNTCAYVASEHRGHL